jgi:hypothetical protein
MVLVFALHFLSYVNILGGNDVRVEFLWVFVLPFTKQLLESRISVSPRSSTMSRKTRLVPCL